MVKGSVLECAAYSRICIRQLTQVRCHRGRAVEVLSASTGESLEKNVLQIYSYTVCGSSCPNPIQFIPILFLPLMIQSFQERLAKACLLLIPRDNQRYVECFRLFWEQKASVVSERGGKM